jgi:hypothetical protein
MELWTGRFPGVETWDVRVGGYDAINGTGGVCHVQVYGNQEAGRRRGET